MSHLHIPDGVLPVWLWSSAWVLTLLAVGAAGLIAERADVRRRVPLLAVVSALMLVAMSSEIVPLAYHVNLTVIGGVLLGPVLSIIAAFIVEVVLALLGHGGVTVLGLNTVIIAAEMLIGWALFRGGVRLLGRHRIRGVGFVATVATLALTTTVLIGIVAIGGAAAAERETGALDPSTLRFENPLSAGLFDVGLFSGGEHHGEHDSEHDAEHEAEHDAEHDAEHAADAARTSARRFATVVFVLGPPGWLLEGLLTAWVLGYVARVRPALLWKTAGERRVIRHPGDEGTVT